MQNFEPFSLAGQQARVTGSSSGLGFEIARLFAEARAFGWVNGRRANAVHDAVAQIENEGSAARALVFDVADDEKVAKTFDTIASARSGVDILINNVGLRDRCVFPEFNGADVRHLLDVDIVAPFLLAQRAAEMMIANKSIGRIVNISSIARLIAQTGDAAYTAAKASLVSLTRALASSKDKQITVFGAIHSLQMVCTVQCGYMLRHRVILD